jgi:hypothetical protein
MFIGQRHVKRATEHALHVSLAVYLYLLICCINAENGNIPNYVRFEVFSATCSRWFPARRFFYPEDGGDTTLRNIGSHKNYMAPHRRKVQAIEAYSNEPQDGIFFASKF